MRKHYKAVLAIALLSSLIFAISIRLLIPQEETYVETYIEQQKISDPIYFTYKFGKSKDSFLTINEEVNKNETFLQILNKHNIAPNKAHELIYKSREMYNLKNILAGSKYTVYKTSDSTNLTKCIVLEANPKETLIFKFDDSISIIKEEKTICVTKKSIGGAITTSLYESLIQQNASPQLAYELSKIFSTKVDFFKIKEGDTFKIIFDEISLENKIIGIGKIYSACFEHENQKFYAINFEEDGKDNFYDEKANNMKQGFLKAPLKFFRISSKFSKNRFHPVQKIFKAHLGTDYAAATGTPILSVGNGVVLEAKYSKFNGNYVKIKHNKTYTTQYLHMSKIAKGIKPGKKITQGYVIGYVGSTGLASGPHVCFRFWKNGTQINPSSVKETFSEPLPKNKIDAFNKLKKEMMTDLDNIKIDHT